MLVSYKWLKKLVNDIDDIPVTDLAEKMSLSGIEIEGVTVPGDGLSKIVVGEVLTCEDVPDTHLHLCQVDVGEDEPLQIVCGAPNVKAGIKAITALVGARIADNYKIKKGKIRGIVSLGMLCALDEIGIPESVNPMKHEEGIYILPEDAVIGDSVLPYLDLDDEIIEPDILANRADAMSMRGVAHEVAAIYGKTVNFEDKKLTEVDRKAADKIAVKVEASTEQVPTYKIRIIENVKIAPSPLWLQNTLMNAGIRPINNVVDVTNYVLMYYGQPLHAFDFDKFGADEILVRQAQDGEKIVTLDEQERKLSKEDIVITANGKPVALGGVMGGLDSEITEQTTNVALEAALFNGTSIRKTSHKFALRSESSSRFEKGINQGTVREALDFAAAMIQELAGGEVLSGVVESNDFMPEPQEVKTTLERINASLGTSLTVEKVLEILAQLGFETQENNGEFHIQIPSRRWDIKIEADIVEEIARIYGYANLPSTLPAGATVGELTAMQKLRRKVRTNVEAAGLSEVIGYSLTSSEKAREFADVQGPTTSLLLPMTEDRQTLRGSQIPGLLDIINYNQNRKNADVAIYEVGNIFLAIDSEDSRPLEIPHLAFAISGNVADKTYNSAAVAVDFYHAKAIVEQLLAGYENLSFEAYSAIKEMHPGRTARVLVGNRQVGFVGQVHPATAKAYDIKETYVASLDLEVMLELAPAQTVFVEVPKVQAVNRDIAMLVDRDKTHAEIVEVITSSKVKSLSKVELFDIYQGENLPEGKKSMAYSLTFQSRENTMTEEEIAKAMAKITKNLTEKLNAEIR
ncbi:phenylalanine--tRNA ligase subunit beta [Lactococcus ileimucosae]|uniref:phenylalanine--tRNA ligase subunit beta n=1 Tax=Lactococcus ileimucosae TaxID=2941329 RepID=UPI00204456A7|nr:phenylalanine--tRNA ligase subunit beta [Lactococcus ileimucosae]